MCWLLLRLHAWNCKVYGGLPLRGNRSGRKCVLSIRTTDEDQEPLTIWGWFGSFETAPRFIVLWASLTCFYKFFLLQPDLHCMGARSTRNSQQASELVWLEGGRVGCTQWAKKKTHSDCCISFHSTQKLGRLESHAKTAIVCLDNLYIVLSMSVVVAWIG